MQVPVTGDDGGNLRDGQGKVVTEDADVDIVAEVYRGDLVAVLMCECKFSRRMCGMPEFRELERRAGMA